MQIPEVVPSPQQDSNTSFSSITGAEIDLDSLQPVALDTLQDSVLLHQDEQHSVTDSELLRDEQTPPPKIWTPKPNAKSAIWNYFETYTHRTYRNLCICLLCDAEVNYTNSMSTTMLVRHLRAKH
jgi:hypothetical protein